MLIQEAEVSEVPFDGQLAYEQALAQCAFGPRPTGSEAGRKTGDYIASQLESLGWRVETEEFDNRGLSVRNIIGKRGEGPVIILGAHYDTRPLADRDPQAPHRPILGGNDGASGVAVLLELARVLPTYHLKNEIWLAFFDAEDRGHIDGWPFSVGARHMAQSLEIQPAYVIVLDMIGDAQQEIYYERNSDPQLRGKIWDIARGLGYGEFVAEEKYSIIDDHTPFLEVGIPAVDIIDFDYPFWHTTEDTCDKISPESLERVGWVMVKLLTED
ncbi:MAG: M28 family peptidase [Anaerolineae bacterium]